ncbi:hypothetical protein Tco_1077317 [Tanacetum coccineum]
MLHVLTVGQTSMPFVHHTSVVTVLALMETMLYILHRHCSLPPEETGCTLPLEETCCSLTACSLPSEERRLAAPYLLRRLAAPYLMRRLAASYLMRRHYSLVIASGPEVAFITLAILANHSNMEGFHPEGFSQGVRLLVRQRVSSGGARLELLVGLDQRLCFISDSLDQKWFRSEVVFHSGYSRLFFGLSCPESKGLSRLESKGVSSGVKGCLIRS